MVETVWRGTEADLVELLALIAGGCGECRLTASRHNGHGVCEVHERWLLDQKFIDDMLWLRWLYREGVQG